MLRLRSRCRTTCFLVVILLFVLALACQQAMIKPEDFGDKSIVVMQTTKGDITIELYPDLAPVSVENFLNYVRSGFYNGTIFHRVIDGFMVQGGGYDAHLNPKPTNPSIVNEANNGLKNTRGTIAYARSNEIKSATSQFFFNLVNNMRLNFKNTTPEGYGYCVFGKVVRGMNVVDHIASVETGTQEGMNDVPVEPIIILSARVMGEL